MTKSEFLKNIVYLASGSAIAQFITIFVYPILTRLYTPEQFGVFSVYLSLTSLFSMISSARYEISIVLPEKDEEAINIVVLCMIIVFLISMVVFLSFVVLPPGLENLLGLNGKKNLIYIVPVSVFLIGIYQTINNWLIRMKMFKLGSIGRTAQSLFGAASKLLFGLNNFKELGLIAGDIVGQLFSLIIIAKFSLCNRKLKSCISLNSMVSMLKKYSFFPKYYLTSAFLDSFTLSFPVFILTKSFGSEVTGYYGLMTKTISIPTIIIANSISQVFYQRVVELRNKNKEILPFVFINIKYLFLVALPISLVLIFFGPHLFSLVFGPGWARSGEYAQIFSIVFLIRFIASPLSMIFAALEKVKIGAGWQILCFFTTLPTLYFASGYSEKTFMYVYAIHDFILYCLYLFLILKVARNKRSSQCVV